MQKTFSGKTLFSLRLNMSLIFKQLGAVAFQGSN